MLFLNITKILFIYRNRAKTILKIKVNNFKFFKRINIIIVNQIIKNWTSKLTMKMKTVQTMNIHFNPNSLCLILLKFNRMRKKLRYLNKWL